MRKVNAAPNISPFNFNLLTLFSVFMSWCAASAHAASPAAGVRMPAYERVTLSNGATLLLMEQHDVPLITFTAYLRGGAMVDTPDKAGASSLLADLLMKGAGSRDALQFAEAVEAAGGQIKTGAGVEAINIQGEFLARDQALMVELLSDLLQRPRLERKEFENLRARAIEFVRAAKDSNLGGLLPIYANAALFGSHPYGAVIGGSESSLGALSYEDVRRVYEQHFGADRLILAVAGDFDANKMKRLLKSRFDRWKAAPVKLPKLAAPSAVTGRRVLLIDAPASVQTYFWIGNVGVARNYPERVSLDVVNTLFGGRFTSMLNSELRIRTGLTYGASSRFRRLTQPGAWAMSSFTRTEATGEAVDLALQVFERLQKEGVDAANLESGKNYVLGQFPTGYETAAQWSSTMAELEFYGLKRDDIDRYAERAAAVDPNKARQIIAAVFPSPENLLLVFIGDTAKIRETVGKYGPVTEMKLSDPVFAN